MPLQAFSPRTRSWFSGGVRGADRGPGAGVAGDRLRRARADLGPDRLRQDAGGVPVRDRPAVARAAAVDPSSDGIEPRLRLAAEGALVRHRPQPPRAAARDRRRADGGRPDRRHASASSASAMLREPPDILITTPESLYLMLTGRAQELFEGVALVHRRRDPRGRLDQARRAPRADARAADRGGRHTTSSGSACRRPRTRSRRSGASWSARSARAASSTPASARSSTSRSRCPVESMVEPDATPVPGPRSAGRRHRGDPPLDLAGDLPRAARADQRAQLDDPVRQQPPRGRADRAAAQRPGGARDRARATTARSRARSGRWSRSCSRRASCRAWSRPRASSSGSTWARSTS